MVGKLLGTKARMGQRTIGRAEQRTSCKYVKKNGNADIELVPLEKRNYYQSVPLADNVTLPDARRAPTDYFHLLSVDFQSSEEDIKGSYRELQRLCHPDRAGESANDAAAHLNAAYAMLSDPRMRSEYTEAVRTFRSEMGAFDGKPVSTWEGGSQTLAVFVDETTCIGCQQCTFCAPKTFALEDHYGRARVRAQWADDAVAIEDAVQMCPVDCIYYVPRSQLALMEYVMKACKREDVAILARRRTGNMASTVGDNPFVRAASFVKAQRAANLNVSAHNVARAHGHELAAAIAAAWHKLPEQVRQKGWPEFGD